MAHRVEVEVSWLIALSNAGLDELPAFSDQAEKTLRSWIEAFSEADVQRIKDIEKKNQPRCQGGGILA